LNGLFACFRAGEVQIPGMYHIADSSENVTICDYIVGMTDNFTGQLYNKISAV